MRKRASAAAVFAMGGRLIAAAIILLVAFSMSSCIIDGTGKEPNPGNGTTTPTTFTATLSAAETVVTRADGTALENSIRSLWVLMFDAATDIYIDKVPTTDRQFSGTANNIVSFKADIPYRRELYDLVFVANATIPSTITPGMTRAEVQLGIAIRKTDSWNVSEGTDEIPMSGELPGEFVDGPRPRTVSLRRSLARVNVTRSAANFTLTDVSVYNYNTAGNVIPNAGANAATPSIPNVAGNKAVGQRITYPATGNAVENRIYIFENRREAIYPLTGWASNPCLVVGGSYNGAAETTYYRLDFVDKTSGAWLDVVRNYSYNFVIASVTGGGYATREEALANPPGNIDIDILMWDESDFPAGTDATTPHYTVAVGESKPAATDGAAIANRNAALPGMTVKMLASSAEGRIFKQWSVATADGTAVALADATANPATFTMPAANVTVTPTFAEMQYGKVTVVSTHPFSANFSDCQPSPGDYYAASVAALNGNGVPFGTTVSYTGTAAAGWGVTGWKVWSNVAPYNQDIFYGNQTVTFTVNASTMEIQPRVEGAPQLVALANWNEANTGIATSRVKNHTTGAEFNMQPGNEGAMYFPTGTVLTVWPAYDGTNYRFDAMECYSYHTNPPTITNLTYNNGYTFTVQAGVTHLNPILTRLYRVTFRQGRNSSSLVVNPNASATVQENSRKALPSGAGVPNGTEVSFVVEYDAANYTYECTDVYNSSHIWHEPIWRAGNPITFSDFYPGNSDLPDGGRVLVAYVNRKYGVSIANTNVMTVHGCSEESWAAIDGRRVLPGTRVGYRVISVADGWGFDGWNTSNMPNHGTNDGWDAWFDMPAGDITITPNVSRRYRVTVNTNIDFTPSVSDYRGFEFSDWNAVSNMNGGGMPAGRFNAVVAPQTLSHNNLNWWFTGWSGAGWDDGDRRRVFETNADGMTLTANYVRAYNVWTNSNPAGANTRLSDDRLGTHGLPADPNWIHYAEAAETMTYNGQTWRFKEWTWPGGSSTDRQYLFTVPAWDGGLTLTANYEQPYPVTVANWNPSNVGLRYFRVWNQTTGERFDMQGGHEATRYFPVGTVLTVWPVYASNYRFDALRLHSYHTNPATITELSWSNGYTFTVQAGIMHLNSFLS